MPLAESGESGLLILDASGRLVHASGRARVLLHLSCNPAMSRRVRITTGLPDPVLRICRRLVAVSRRENSDLGPPVWSCRNAWGGFTFRAYWLDRADAVDPDAIATDGLIGVAIERRQPLPLKLLQCDEVQALSPRQSQVCLMLASGHSLRSIAEYLGVSWHTVNYHCREIYVRLGVSSRHEMVASLLDV